MGQGVHLSSNYHLDNSLLSSPDTSVLFILVHTHALSVIAVGLLEERIVYLFNGGG